MDDSLIANGCPAEYACRGQPVLGELVDHVLVVGRVGTVVVGPAHKQIDVIECASLVQTKSPTSNVRSDE